MHLLQRVLREEGVAKMRQEHLKLCEYQEFSELKFEKKVKHKKLPDTEIDAIILETVIKTNEEIIELNNIIEEIWGQELESNLTIKDLERSICRLSWLKICTMDQLRDFISGNKKCAVDIAKDFLQNFQKGEGRTANRTIAFFYLCYAELLCKNYNVDKILEYLSDNDIEIDYNERKQAAKKLYQLREKLNIVN